MAIVTPGWLLRLPTARRNSAASAGGIQGGSSTTTRLTPTRSGAKPKKRMLSAAGGRPPIHTRGRCTPPSQLRYADAQIATTRTWRRRTHALPDDVQNARGGDSSRPRARATGADTRLILCAKVRRSADLKLHKPSVTKAHKPSGRAHRARLPPRVNCAGGVCRKPRAGAREERACKFAWWKCRHGPASFAGCASPRRAPVDASRSCAAGRAA